MPKKIVNQTILYPVIIHRENDTFGYFSPEFGGGGASTFAEALRLAQQLLEEAIASFETSKEPIPAPSDPEQIDPQGGQVAWLPVKTSNAAERIFITLPKSLLARIDATTSNRSAFFTELAQERLNAGSWPKF